MAERMALFHAAPGKKARSTPWFRRGPAVGKPAPEAESGTAAKAKPGTAAKPAAKSKTAVKTTSRAKSTAAADPTGKPAPKPAPKSDSKPKPAAGTKSGAKRAPRRPRKPPPPVLQRDTLVSTLARLAVMAVAIVCMVGFAVALARVTLVPSPASVHLIHTNLRPGASIRAYLDQPALRDTVKQIGGNIVLGVPFGVLLPMLFPRARGLLRVVVLTALVMLMVETTQGALVVGRAFDIDDVILNTTGSLLGYLLLGRRLGRALHPRRAHWWHRYGIGGAAAGEQVKQVKQVRQVRQDRRPARKRP